MDLDLVKGTEDILLQLRHQIDSNLKTSRSCCVVYFDLKGAFDGVWRQGLLYKLSEIGVRGNLLRWLSSYLSNRTQVVQLHGYLSDELDSNIGVPQGGVLSPILFNIMMNDFPTDNKVETYIFADDITVACNGNSTADVEEILRRYLERVNGWFRSVEIFCSTMKKTKFQFFTRRKRDRPTVAIGGRVIEMVREQRLLGVYFDAPTLNWRAHIDHLVANCTRRNRSHESTSRYKNLVVFSCDTKKNFYISYIRSKINVLFPQCFCLASKTQLRRLDIIQNACIRLMLGARRSSPIISLEVEANVPPLTIYVNHTRVKTLVKLHFKPSEDMTAKDVLVRNRNEAWSLMNDNLLSKYNMGGLHRQPTGCLSAPLFMVWIL